MNNVLQVDDVSNSQCVSCYLGIAAETLVIVEESSGDVVFTTHCGSIIGWTSQALWYGRYSRVP